MRRPAYASPPFISPLETSVVNDQPDVTPRASRVQARRIAVAALPFVALVVAASACGGSADAGPGVVQIEPIESTTALVGSPEAGTPTPTASVAEASTVEPTATPVPATPTTEPIAPAAAISEPTVVMAAPTTLPQPSPPGAAPTGSLAGLRIYANGDSTSYFMSVAALQGAVALGAVQVQPAPEYQISSGLNNSSYFDWFGYMSSEMALYDPGLVVFMVGANDAHPGIDLASYRQRVGAMMDQLSGRRLVWAGQPNMGRADLAAAIPGMNQVFREEAAKRPWVTYVDTWALTSDPAGAFTSYMVDASGASVLGRADDGVHFTSAGGAILGQAVLAAILSQ